MNGNKHRIKRDNRYLKFSIVKHYFRVFYILVGTEFAPVTVTSTNLWVNNGTYTDEINI